MRELHCHICDYLPHSSKSAPKLKNLNVIIKKGEKSYPSTARETDQVFFSCTSQIGTYRTPNVQCKVKQLSWVTLKLKPIATSRVTFPFVSTGSSANPKPSVPPLSHSSRRLGSGSLGSQRPSDTNSHRAGLKPREKWGGLCYRSTQNRLHIT